MTQGFENTESFGSTIQRLNRIRFTLLTSIQKDSALTEFLAAVRECLQLDDLAIYFVNVERQSLERGPRLGGYRAQQANQQRLDIYTSVQGKAALFGEPVWNHLFSHSNELRPRPRVQLCIPIRIDRQVVAVLDLLTPDPSSLSDDKQQVLEWIALDLAIAMANLRTVHGLKSKLNTDELTGLFNRHHFVEMLEIELKRSKRSDSPLGVLFLELDRATEITKRHGEAAIEKAMLQLAQVLKRNVRSTDIVGRFSETAFALTLGGTDIEKALFVGEKFRKLIQEQTLEGFGSLSVSIGVSIYPLQGSDREELLFMAQQAARLAYHAGGNQLSTLGSDSLKMMALKVLTGVLYKDFETGPQAATVVADQIEEAASDPVFSPLVAQMVESLASAIDAKDHYTKSHSEEATVYGEALGKAAGLSDKQIELVRMAAKLHDLGKIGVPERILNKSGSLNAEEWKIMKEHPAIGARILEPIQSLSELVPIVRCHHERWDGSGYPEGLQGESIPVEARIIGIIDSFHAIISQRPYKPAMPVSHGLDQLRLQAGTKFDPDLVETFCSLIHTDGNIRMPWKTETASPVDFLPLAVASGS